MLRDTFRLRFWRFIFYSHYFMEITSLDHASQVKKSGQTLLRVYWNECGACVESKPDWERVVAQTEKMLNPDCLVCQVENGNLEMLNSVLDPVLEVPTVPSYIWLVRGERQPDEPERTVPSLLKFLNKHRFLKKGPKSRARGRSNKSRLGKARRNTRKRRQKK